MLIAYPSRGEEEDVDTDKGDEHFAGHVGVGRDTDDSNDEFAGAHAQSTPDKERSAAKLLNTVESERRASDVDNSGDHANQKGVFDANLREEGDVVVEDKVDASPLRKQLAIWSCMS